MSKSGASFSQRTGWGSIGSRGFSIRTGIPGLYFRKSWGKGGSGLVVYLVVGGLILSALVIYNLARLLWFVIVYLYNKVGKKT
ncbi:MAG: hypothetical protein RLO81_09725 [Fulvivirga sp.]|uniref:hypothetical protein n=1 Tax=Fulvivirga sp. TaxID=1931237 RepID=UPI0032EF740C